MRISFSNAYLHIIVCIWKKKTQKIKKCPKRMQTIGGCLCCTKHSNLKCIKTVIIKSLPALALDQLWLPSAEVSMPFCCKSEEVPETELQDMLQSRMLVESRPGLVGEHSVTIISGTL